MAELQAQRTLVKSPPELWAEVSDAESLAKHLSDFGEIRITRIEPDKIVAWEGELASGTIELAKSGWGTKIVLSAELTAIEEVEPEVIAEPEPVAEVISEPEPVAEAEPEPQVAPDPEPVVAAQLHERPGFFARLFGRKAKLESDAIAESPVEIVVPEPAPVAIEQTEIEIPDVEFVAEAVIAEPVAIEVPEVEPSVRRLDETQAQELLSAVLDVLGAAHHRPFSRG